MGTQWVVAAATLPGLIQKLPLDFRTRSVEKLERLGDIARDSKKHDEAIGYYSNALLLDPTNNDILLKRSKEVRSVFRVPSDEPRRSVLSGHRARPIIP